MDDQMLDREIESLLSVDPAPDFMARVRARVAAEPAREPWIARWVFAGAAIAAGILSFVVLRVGPAPTPTPELASRAIQAVRHLSLVPVAPRRPPVPRARRTIVRSGPRTESEVVISLSEAAAWLRLLEGVEAGDLDLSRLARASDEPAELLQQDEFVLPPITIEPLMPEPREQGVHP